MSRRILYTAIIAALAGAGAGFTASNRLMAAAGPDPTAALTAAARLGITAYEKEDQAGGCGAPEKNLLDNDEVRVDLVSFPKGFDRCGMLKRRYNQLLVYIDPGDFQITRGGVNGDVRPISTAPRKPLPPGSIAWHPRDTLVSETHIFNAYRVLFVQIKK